MRHKLALAVLAVALLMTGLVTNVAYAQPPGATIVVVTEDDIVRQAENTEPTNNWVLFTRTVDSVGAIEPGPGVPPVGPSSLHLTTPTSSDKVFIFNYDHIGTALADIDAMSYATYRTSGTTANQVPSLNLQIDFNGPAVDGGFATLVWEPVYNTGQGAIVDGTWQNWDAINAGAGVWWSTRDINGQCAGATTLCWKSWDYIIANNPDATILGGFGINQGSGNPALIAATDALTIGVNGATTVYNFDIVTAADLMDSLQADTAELVTNAAAERALLATLTRAEMYINNGNKLMAYLTMLQYVIQVERYEDSRRINGPAAQELVSQALDLTRLIMTQPIGKR
jgi:hypothetical protein